MIKCKFCKKEYTPKKKIQQFCGRSCAMKFSRQNNTNWKTNKGKKFPQLSGENNSSKRPEIRKKLSAALKGRDLYWGQKIADSRQRNGYKPTLATKLKQRESHIKRVRAGLHNNYKGGVTKENEKIRKSVEYKIWRQAVFERDDYTCQTCGVRGGDIEADHVMPFAEYPDLRFEILNGRTLCKACHYIRTKEQLKLTWKNQYVRKI